MRRALAINGGSKTRIEPFHHWPVFGREEENALLDVLRSGRWGRLGDEAGRVRDFEQAFAAYHGAEYGTAVVNGTIALRVALLAAGLEAGDEVIVPHYTFQATATSVVETNCVPVFVDIHPDTYCIDPGKIESAVTPRTRAIIPVHIGGQPADMDRIMEIARRHDLVVIEDAAQAHGAEYKGRRVGSIGDMGCFSFQSSKNLTAGEGGIVITNNEEYARLCYSIHNCGRLPEGKWYEHHVLGANFRMTEFQGAILSCGLARLEEHTNTRDANGRYLNEKLSEIPGIRPLARGCGETRHAYHLYIFRYDSAAFGGVSRERFLQALQAEGIPCSGGYGVPLCHQPLFVQKAFGPYSAASRSDVDYAATKWPVCEKACYEEGCWLMHPILLGSREDMDDVAAAVRKIYDHREELV